MSKPPRKSHALKIIQTSFEVAFLGKHQKKDNTQPVEL